MKDLPTIIFDFDGTLADSEKYVFEIFQKLSKKYLKRRLTIKENKKIFLEKNKMDFFDFLNCGTSLLGKGRILSKVIKERKYIKENVIYVGDEIRDIDAARKIKIKVAVVTWGFNPKEALIKYNPDFIIEKPEELLLLVKQHFFGK